MVKFLLLLLFHLLGEFYFQNINFKKDENEKIKRKFIIIQTIKYIFPFLGLFFIMNWFYGLLCILIIMISHLILLIIDVYFSQRIKGTIVLILDQMLHIVFLFLISKYINTNSNFIKIESVVKITVCILLIIVPSSTFINIIFQDLYPELKYENGFDVGSIIGILERMLIFLLAIFEEFTAMAIIITIKTWARSNDLKEQSFRNKYLIGTLTSFVLALITYLFFCYC